LWIDPSVSRWRAAAVCFAAALCVFGLESIAWPLMNGRDAGTYLIYYVDMWHSHPALPALMLFRTPLAPLVFGAALQVGGAVLAELAAAMLYGVSVVALAAAAYSFGRVAAVVTAVAVLAYPGYGALFHQVSSDPVFACAYAIWTLGMIRTLRNPSTARFAVLGACVIVLVLARPGSQVVLAVGIAPLVLGTTWRSRLAWSGSFLAAAVGGLALWAGYNDLRYGSFVVARAGWANIPFYRVFIMEKLVRADNGPASRALAGAVRRDLLTKPPYPQIGIKTPDQFFSIASDHMWGDVVYITDREWGWQSDYAILRRVSLEAIRRHPRLYVRDVGASVWDELRIPYVWRVPSVAKPPPSSTSSPSPSVAAKPTSASAPDDDPGGRYWWLASTPDGRPPNPSSIARMMRELKGLHANFPDRSGSPTLAAILNRISRIYPWAGLWLAVTAIALVVRRPAGSVVLLFTAALALAAIIFTELGEPPGLAYGLPFVPIFILCGVAAVTGDGGRVRRWRLPTHAFGTSK
jgi:hypothetical protein